MRKHPRAFIFFPLVIAIVLSLATPAFAYYYCYDYGINWNQPPFNLSMTDDTACGTQAAAWQNLRSGNYYAKAYSSTWSSDVFQNRNAAHILYTATHGTDGSQIYYGTPTRYHWSNGSATNVSCYRTTSTPTLHDHGAGTSPARQLCSCIRYATSYSSTGVRLAVFQSCSSGGWPAGAQSVAYATWAAVTPCVCSVGFYRTLGGSSAVSHAWADSFWGDLRYGWSVGNAMDRAEAAVTRYAGGPCGYEYHVGEGNPAMTLLQ